MPWLYNLNPIVSSNFLSTASTIKFMFCERQDLINQVKREFCAVPETCPAG